MCQIIYKPAGVELPYQHVIDAVMENQDGVGMMFMDERGIVTRRSLEMNEIAHWREIDSKDLEFALHMRYATHGTRTVGNAHPFRIDYRLALMHNGIISELRDPEGKLSDTALLARRILPVLMGDLSAHRTPEFREMLELVAGSFNRFLILDDQGVFSRINASSWYKDDTTGIYYSSNPAHMRITHVVSYPTKSYSRGSTTITSRGFRHWDDEDDEAWAVGGKPWKWERDKDKETNESEDDAFLGEGDDDDDDDTPYKKDFVVMKLANGIEIWDSDIDTEVEALLTSDEDFDEERYTSLRMLALDNLIALHECEEPPRPERSRVKEIASGVMKKISATVKGD